MEQTMLWITVFGIIVIPLVGWIFNTLITRKIDNLEAGADADKKLFFEQLNGLRASFKEELKVYVNKELYDQYKEYQEKDIDSKFKSMIQNMTIQFQNVENKIDELKEAIKGNKNNHQPGG